MSESDNIGSNVFQFTPSNSSVYDIVLNISGNQSNYAYITKEGSPWEIQVKNITNNGPIILDLTINSTGSNNTTNGSWDPLFGLTGLRLNTPPLNFDSSIVIVGGVGVLLMAVGLALRSKISYLGAVFLLLAGALALGLLLVFGIIMLYVLSFTIVNLFWRFYVRRHR